MESSSTKYRWPVLEGESLFNSRDLVAEENPSWHVSASSRNHWVDIPEIRSQTLICGSVLKCMSGHFNELSYFPHLLGGHRLGGHVTDRDDVFGYERCIQTTKGNDRLIW